MQKALTFRPKQYNIKNKKQYQQRKATMNQHFYRQRREMRQSKNCREVNFIMQIEGEVRIPSGCAISGIFSRSGQKMNGEAIIKSIATMGTVLKIISYCSLSQIFSVRIDEYP